LKLIWFPLQALFFASRKYLLNSLYHDLQDMSSGPSSSLDAESMEMDVLPTPSTSSQNHDPKQSSAKRAFHSRLSWTLFSISFSESCMLFVLLMCQGLDIFHYKTRLINWQISLAVLLASILVIIPLSYSLVLSYRSLDGTWHRADDGYSPSDLLQVHNQFIDRRYCASPSPHSRLGCFSSGFHSFLCHRLSHRPQVSALRSCLG